ncbi:MAG TPA: dihydrodipicolinate synthase family protein [Vicinamibacterales bacterium]|jgi:5-dehydro-4-deoxyglucarate dehydratase|nr:dihydrodipicolinate synthase family protein [Vicinamibacterales bacterium]
MVIEQLEGVIAFPVTPFADDLSLDVAALRRNVQAILRHPVAAIVAAGGTGELYSLTPSEHLAVVSAIVDEAKGRIPVIAGTGFGAALGVQLAQQAAGAGAWGILAFPPYYPQADDDGLLAYYRAIASATPLGLIIYSRDWFHPSPEFVARLAEIRTLVAWKDGQGDIRRLQAIMQRVGSRLHWIGGAGDDLVPAYYALGIRAFTSSVANVAPAIALQLHTAASNGDSAQLQRLMREYVVPLYALRGRRRGYEVTVMKALMDRVGLAGGRVRPPLAELSSQDAADVLALVPRWLESGT